MQRKNYDYKKDTVLFSSPRTNIIELIFQLNGMTSVLDLGCGKISNLRFLNKNIYLYGIDAYEKDINNSKSLKIHNEYIIDNILNVDRYFQNNSVDACVALDVIEHLTKDNGLLLIKKIEQIAKKKIIIFTPNGFLPQKSNEEGDYQEHLSGWEVDEMKNLGFKVYGSDGLKVLRGEYHRLKYQPYFIWAILSWLTQQFWCKKNPKSAAALLCVKELVKK
ncbi:MAG: methyltransferase domain-containing protein [Candidatus Edwardsbacteria bacterium]